MDAVMNTKVEGLRKRTKSDMIASFAMALLAVYIVVVELYKYGNAQESSFVHLTNGIYAISFGIIEIILGLILLEVHKLGKPFSKRIINGLRALAVWVMITGIMPDMLAPIIDQAGTGYIELPGLDVLLSAHNLVIVALGVVIGVISEIFVYGYELQEDNDLIA